MTTTRLPLPADLRAQVLAAAADARAAGRSLTEVAVISPAEAFRRAAEAFSHVLGALEASQWELPVLRDLDVQGLTGHLLGVERDVQQALTGGTDVADADHVGSTQPAALDQAGRPPEQTLAAWEAAVEETLRLVTDRLEDPSPVALHGLRLPPGPLLVVRAFELWAHEDDVRQAAGLPARAPEPPVLHLMTALAVQALPRGMRLAGTASGALDLHLVLTGPGGGTWDVRLGRECDTDRADHDDGAVPEVGIVIDAVTFCRLVANRVSPQGLELDVTGAVSYAPEVLAGAAALALD
jgi:uncharacterized protein (TIGR03083 family)